MRRPARHRVRLQGPRRAAGFSLLELAVSVTVIGVLGMLATSGYADFAQVRARARAQAEAEVALQAVRTFALKNKRLPCPDLSANGDGAREGAAGTCPAGAQVGWLPYETLGLTRPDRSMRMRYAVSRGGGADLVAPAGGASDGLDLDGNGRLRATLGAAARLPAGSDRPYLTGRGSPAEPESCGSVRANPAFALVAPVSDRDDAGGLQAGFDGVNLQMAASGSLCIASPGRAMDAAYDDVVVAEGASALLGWLAAHTR
jgi:prepilin-type N-terminal cleavage/methylation domain-containing protein